MAQAANNMTLGAIASNEKDILKRKGAYSVRKANAIPGGGSNAA